MMHGRRGGVLIVGGWVGLLQKPDASRACRHAGRLFVDRGILLDIGVGARDIGIMK